MGKGRFQPIMRRHTSRVSCAAVAAAVVATQNGKSVGEEAEETAGKRNARKGETNDGCVLYQLAKIYWQFVFL